MPWLTPAASTWPMHATVVEIKGHGRHGAADFDEIHRVNVRGTFVVNQQPARRVRDGGSIVNVCAWSGWRPRR